MQRYKCVVAYDGTAFSGYQIQPDKRTIQEEIEKVLAKLHKGDAVKISASGRTDAGVHARGQVIHFDSPLSIPLEKWPVALNTLLPDDISIMSAEKVTEDFHARFDAVGKEYRYYLNTAVQRDPFNRHFAYHYPYLLDVAAMKQAAKELLGTHDFTSFCSAKTEVEDRVRTVYAIDILEHDSSLVFRFNGNGFLYNMVRILVGTLLEVGAGTRPASSMQELLDQKDRRFAGKTAPAHGLYLWQVFYD